MDWSTIANVLVAIATFVLACVAVWQGRLMKKGLDLSRKELSMLKTQTDLYRQERELAKRPNLFVHPYGLQFAWKMFPGIVGDRKEPLYFLLLNMSEHPIEYSGGYIYKWQPGEPITVDPRRETGRISFLNVPSDKGATSLVRPGEHVVLIPNEEEAVFKLFPEHKEQETTFIVVLMVLYPRAPGGVVYFRVPIRLRRIEDEGVYSDSTYIGWSLDEYVSVEFPVAKGILSSSDLYSEADKRDR